MVKVVWTQRALLDLEDIGEYISKDSIRYAKLTLEKLLDAASLIVINPLLGRIVPETSDKSIRERIIGSYRVIYQIRSDNFVLILTVFHSARLLSEKDLK
jgi:toxin ParE1/3/4